MTTEAQTFLENPMLDICCTCLQHYIENRAASFSLFTLFMILNTIMIIIVYGSILPGWPNYWAAITS
jgi:hypothetical protein